MIEEYKYDSESIGAMTAIIVFGVVLLIVSITTLITARDVGMARTNAAHTREYNEMLQEELNRWRVLKGAEVWAHEFNDIEFKERELGTLDGRGEPHREVYTEESTKAVVYIAWYFESREEADEFLKLVGPLLEK